jgi:hypothetical protein
MGFLKGLANLFSRGGRDENQLEKAMELAKTKQPAEALVIYNDLLTSPGTSSETKARALFNRALTYSALKDDTRATADLKQLTTQPDIPENIRTAARNQLVRLTNRKTA